MSSFWSTIFFISSLITGASPTLDEGCEQHASADCSEAVATPQAEYRWTVRPAQGGDASESLFISNGF